MLERRSISLVVAIAIVSSAFIVSNVDAKKPKEVWPGVRGGLGGYELADSDAERIVFMAEAIGWSSPKSSCKVQDVALNLAILNLYGAAGIPIDQALREQVNLAAAALPTDAANVLSDVTSNIACAVRDRHAAFAPVPTWAMRDLGEWVASGMTGPIPEPASTMISENFDPAFLLGAAMRVFDASNIVHTNANVWPSLPVAWQDPVGLMCLGTKGPDTYEINEGKWICIDPDGTDTWKNNAGGATPDPGVLVGSRPIPINAPGKVCVPDLQPNPNPVPPGGCTTVATLPVGIGNYAPVALAIDLGGDDDVYDAWNSAPTWRTFCAQGGAIAGVGFLEDDGGNNIFEAGTDSQGGATIGGIGILNLSGTGNDDHDKAGSNALGGAGSAALALLIDWGGDDEYTASGSPSLGSALGNAAAYFDDRGGVDTYDRHVTGGVAGALTGSTTSTIVRFIDRGTDTDNYWVAGSPDTSSYPWGNNKSWPAAPDAPRGFDNVFPLGPCPLNGPCS